MAGANCDVFICFLFCLENPLARAAHTLHAFLAGWQEDSDAVTNRSEGDNQDDYGDEYEDDHDQEDQDDPDYSEDEFDEAGLDHWKVVCMACLDQQSFNGQIKSIQIPSNTVQRCRMLQLGFLSLRPGAARAPLKLHRWQARHLATRPMPSSVKRCKTHTNQICLAFTRHEVEVNPVMTLGILG